MFHTYLDNGWRHQGICIHSFHPFVFFRNLAAIFFNSLEAKFRINTAGLVLMLCKTISSIGSRNVVLMFGITSTSTSTQHHQARQGRHLIAVLPDLFTLTLVGATASNAADAVELLFICR